VLKIKNVFKTAERSYRGKLKREMFKKMFGFDCSLQICNCTTPAEFFVLGQMNFSDFK